MSANTPSTSPSGLVALSTVVPILCIAAVGLRFQLRRKQTQSVQIDDWIMLPALVGHKLYCFLVLWMLIPYDGPQILFVGMCICAILGIAS